MLFQPSTRPAIPNTNVLTKALLALILLSIPLTEAAAKTKNSKPLANAGIDQNAALSSSVNLNGTKSTDSDGFIKKYQWLQTKGNPVKLIGAKTATPSFISPAKLKKNTTSIKLTFKLTVADDKKATARDTVVITIAAAPICKISQVLKDNVCITPPLSCTPPKVLQNNSCVLVCPTNQVIQGNSCVTPPPACAEPETLQNGICVKPIPVCSLPKVLQYGVCVFADSINKINDTGITACSDGSFIVDACTNARFPGQDAEFGRDQYINDDSDGHAGFSYTKISGTGAELPANAPSWSCVKDNVTGLIWEVKTDDDGLRDKDLTYSYYSPNFNPINQYGTTSDVSGFINTANQQSLCGSNDWRLPSNQELQSLIDYSIPLPGPVIDTNYFPNTRNTGYWTSSPHPRNSNGAWVAYFDDGRIFDDFRQREGGAAIRLVHSSGTNDNSSRYIISEDNQEVTDTETGLIWRRCVEGTNWNGNTCAGESAGYMFEEALQQANTQAILTGNNWRLPNMKELASLADTSRAILNTDLAINSNVFPATPNFASWTSSVKSSSQDAFDAWVVHFYTGAIFYTYSEDTGAVRLVRDGE